jgi:hypothetical protein
LRDNTVQLGTRPARFHEQPMDVRERLNASLDCVFETIGRVGLTKMHCRLNSRQHVLGSMFGLTGEDGNLLLGSLALSYVHERSNSAGNFSICILHRGKIHDQ